MIAFDQLFDHCFSFREQGVECFATVTGECVRMSVLSIPQLAESLGAKAAGIDLGDDGTLTRSEKLMIFSRFYKKHMPGDKRRGGPAAIELLVKRYRGAKFIALCANMKRKYGESPLEMWENLMGGAEERKRDLDHELAVIEAEEAHQVFLKETTEEHETLLKLAQAFLRQQEEGGAGKAESGRLQNLRFHLQPFCAIWTVEGVPADPDGRSRDPVMPFHPFISYVPMFSGLIYIRAFCVFRILSGLLWQFLPRRRS